MTEPLQSFDWKNSNYERPDNSWVCGRMCESGEPCRLGPSSAGECQLQTRCQPAEKDGKYQCTRSTINGGKCKEGPASDGSCCQSESGCQPRRSLLAKRRLLGVITTVIAASISLAVFSGSSPSALLSPGDVTAAHANIESECHACHAAGEGGFATWIQRTLDGDISFQDSTRCLKCHTELGPDALLAHGLSVNSLSENTQRIQSDNESSTAPFALQLSSLAGHTVANEKLACSTCHREHHGRKASLTQLSDFQCQTCHTKQFASFEHGHPTLGNYPYKRRSKIYFDHRAHLNHYFVNEEFKRTMPSGQKPESCKSCHTLNESGSIMLTGKFENTCASCHEPQIEDLDFPGVPFFALPAIPSQILKSQGEWPNTNGAFKTARLPRLMELLLEHDPEYQKAVVQLGSFDYRRLSSIAPEQYNAITEIAWSIKRLLYDIAINGESALEQRLGNSHPEYLHLKPSIIPTLSQAQQIWFPNLVTDLKLHREKKPIPGSPKQASAPGTKLFSTNASSGWSISDSDFTIRYRPLGHADPLLKSWLDQSIKGNQQSRDSNSMWRILSNPTASGLEDTQGALASGRCLMCHSVDHNPESGSAQINWQPLQQPQDRFTQFSHTPHILASHTLADKEANCMSCHKFDASEKEDSAILKRDYFVRDPSNLYWKINFDCQQSCTSGFQPISQQNCVTCHNKTTATQSCLQCHKYHAQKPPKNQ
ncbi:MAG: cytochrome c3 family protein [Gimesia sp.]